ncbi:MAG TPA: hypothetical protein VNE59_13030 [Burkholderiales bacterium]|nr:hypothetical protein [Burkholderiales bacterium]
MRPLLPARAPHPEPRPAYRIHSEGDAMVQRLLTLALLAAADKAD